MQHITRLLTLTFFGATLGCATTAPPPASPEPASASASTSAEFPVFNWAQVSEALSEGALLVDARGAASFARGHIPSAVHGPSRDQEALVAALPEDKSRRLIFYCGGPACAASARAAHVAHVRGHTDIAEYKGGYPDWRDRQPAPAPDCSALDWAACQEAPHCEPTHEQSDEPGHPGFSCLPLNR